VSDWAPRAAASAVAALVAFACSLDAGPLRAEPARVVHAEPADSSSALEGLPIARVDIRARNIFDPVPDGNLAPLYRLANRFHVRTRARTLRERILLEPGQPFQEALREESLRILRSLDYVEPQRIEARRRGEAVVVTVETRDAWTTSPEFNLERGGGRQYGSFGISERNLLGLGKALSLQYHEDPAGISRSFALTDPTVLGSRHRFHYGAASGTSGSSDIFSFELPFYAQDAPLAYGLSWRRNSSVARLFQNASEVASFSARVHLFEAWGARGERRDGTIRRVTGSFAIFDRGLGPSQLEPGAPPAFAGGEEHLRLGRLTGEWQAWRPHYVQCRGVERIDRTEDYDVGSVLGVALGVAPRLLGSTADEGYVRARADAGVETAVGFGYVRTAASMRVRRSPLEVIRSAEARWVWPTRAGHALVLAARGVAGSRVSRDFQAVVGGLSGLRAYPVQAVAGRELVRLNAEQRWVVGRNYWDLVSIGGAVFYDAAHAWGPGAGDGPWFHAAGCGIRLATPRSALGPVLRADIAWPVSPTRDARRQPVFSFGSSQAF
jgi:hypothetical protein